MRTAETMMETILRFAREDARVRIVGMEGSRVNTNAPRDRFQDFDITFFVEEIAAFTGDDAWLAAFGNPILLQKPEDMELFEAVEEGYSYLILFDDYNKLDLTLLEMRHLPGYLRADRLRVVLLDKDAAVGRLSAPTDADYQVRRPSPRSFDDCCNEFWFLTVYVVKGLCRGEILYAADHLQLLRDELLRMLSWRAGFEHGFCFSAGKRYKYLERYIPEAVWKRLLATYRTDTYAHGWEALFACHALFREAAAACAEALGCAYPPYDQNVSAFAAACYAEYGSRF